MEKYYIQFTTEDGREFLVEADEGTVSEESPSPEEMEKAGIFKKAAGKTIVFAQTTFEQAIGNVIRYNVKALLRAIRDLPVENQPKSMEATFGLKATADAGNAAVARASGEANYTIKLTWER
jgi:Trypsin-co-occurring domain 1